MSIMAHSGWLRSTPVSSLCSLLLPVTYKLPPAETQNSSSEPALQRDSCTGAAQCPWVSVRLGMAMRGRGRDLAEGGTVVKPTRRAPCQLNESFSTLRRILSWIFTGRLLNTRPFLNVFFVFSARRHPWLRRTMSPTTRGWKVRGPRQDRPHLCDVSDPTSVKGTKTQLRILSREPCCHTGNNFDRFHDCYRHPQQQEAGKFLQR